MARPQSKPSEDDILEESFIVHHKPFNPQQKTMTFFFMIVDFFHAILTISIGPITQAMVLAHEGVTFTMVHCLSFLTILACFLAFFPSSLVVTKLGLRWGLFSCVFLGFLGSILCLFISKSFYLYMIGYFVMQFGLQGIHCAKGAFVNRFFTELDVFYFLTF